MPTKECITSTRTAEFECIAEILDTPEEFYHEAGGDEVQWGDDAAVEEGDTRSEVESVAPSMSASQMGGHDGKAVVARG